MGGLIKTLSVKLKQTILKKNKKRYCDNSQKLYNLSKEKPMNISKEEAAEIVEKYLDEKWAEIQSVDFPPLQEREITEKDCINELKNNKVLKNWKTPSKIVRYFNKSLFSANKGGNPSPK